MRRTRVCLAALALTALAVTAGCDDGTGITLADVQGTYVLVLMDSSTLPVVDESATSIRTTLADTLRMGADFRARQTQVQTREDLAQRTIIGPAAWSEDFTYRIAGDRIELRYVCPVLALCGPAVPFMATLTNDILQFTFRGRRHVYARVSRTP